MLKWLRGRLFTFALYVLVIIGGTNWDHDPNSWRLIVFRLISVAAFLFWAVYRTVDHWHGDQKKRLDETHDEG